MIRLHERTRRGLCRGLFLAVAVLPVLSVAAWAAVANWPGRSERWQRELSRHLGLAVQLDDAREPAPGVTLLSQLELRDPESGQPILSARALEFRTTGTSEQWIAFQPQWNARGLDAAASLIRRRLREQTLGLAPTLRIECRELTIESGDYAQTLVGVLGTFARTQHGAKNAWQFRLAGDDPQSPPVVVVIARERVATSSAAETAAAETTAVATTLEIHTAGRALPLAPLADWYPGLRRLGPTAEFRGRLAVTDISGQTQLTCAGELLDVDLNELVTAQFPHKFGGQATITLPEARLENGRLVSAKGTLVSRGGTIGRSLLRAAADHLGCQAASEPGETAAKPSAAPQYLRYDQLAIDFEITGGQLTLRAPAESGSPPSASAPRRPLIVRTQQSLLSEPLENPQPLVRMIQVLSATTHNTPTIPTTAAWLLTRLPADSPRR